MRYLAAFLVSLLLLIHNLPYLIKDQALIWLKQQGVSEPKIKEVSIDWLKGAFGVSNITAQSTQGSAFKLGSLEIDLKVLSLIEQRIQIESLKIEGLESAVTQTSAGTFIGPININQFQSSDNTPAQTSQSNWQFGIDKLDISAVQWLIDIDPYQQNISIEQASLRNLRQWQKNQVSEITFIGAINDSAIHIDTRTSPLQEDKKTQLTLTLDQFDLQSVLQPLLPQLKATVSLDIDLAIEFVKGQLQLKHKGSVAVERLAWQDSQNNVKLAMLNWQGEGELIAQANTLQKIDAHGDLVLQKLALKQVEGMALALDKFTWQGPIKADLSQTKQQSFEVSQHISAQNLSLIAANTDVSIAALKLAPGITKIEILEQQLQKIQLQPTLTLSQVKIKADKNKVSTEQLALTTQQPLEITFNERGIEQLASSVKVALTKLIVDQPNTLKLASDKLNVSGPVLLSSLSKQPRLTSQIKLSVQGIKAQLAKITMQANNVQASVASESMLFSKPDISKIKLAVKNLQLKKSNTSSSLVSLAKVDLAGGFYDHQKLGFSALQLEQLSLKGDSAKAPLLELAGVKVNSLALLEQKRLNIGSVAINALQANIKLNERAQITALDKLSALQGPAIKSESNTKKSPPLQVALQSFVLNGKSVIKIEDKSVSPWFKSQLDLAVLSLKNLDTASAQTSPFVLKAKLNGRSSIDVKGQYSLFAQQKKGDWTLALKDLSMPIISPYAGKYSGYYLDSGQLAVNSSGTIKSNVLKGESKITIQQLAVSSADSAATTKTNSSLNMPLDMAISILEDGEGKIELQVPVSGSLDDPNFGYASVLEIIAKKGLKQAAFGILSKALQPYGALITLASSAIDAQQTGSFINLAPVEFQPNSVLIEPKMADYLQKIANMMLQRKKLKLNICATAVLQDNKILAPLVIEQNSQLASPLKGGQLQKNIINTLQLLATERGEKVKANLEALKVKSDRLFLCLAKVNLEKKSAKPTVSLGL